MCNSSNGMLELVKGMKIDCREVERGYVRGSGGKLCSSKTEKGRILKDHMERILNEVIC